MFEKRTWIAVAALAFVGAVTTYKLTPDRTAQKQAAE